MNKLLALISSIIVIASGAYYTGIVNDRVSVYILAAGIAAMLSWRFISKSHKQKEGRGESILDASDPPGAAIAYGIFRGLGYCLGVSLIFFVAWGLDYWQLPLAKLNADGVNIASPAVVNHPVSTLGPSAKLPETIVDSVKAKVLGCEVHYDMNFVEVVVPTGVSSTPYSHAALIDSFLIKVDGEERKPVSVERFDWEAPIAVYCLRDISGSILAHDPFPRLVTASTEHTIDVILADSRRQKQLRVADFAGDLIVTCDWTASDALRHLRRPIPIATSENSTSSAIAKHIVSGIDELGTKADCERILIVTSDFQNNVASTFDTAGIAAYAKHSGVKLLLIGLPTAALTPRQIDAAKRLADTSDGAYADGADPKLGEIIRRVIDSTRKPIPAYRLALSGHRKLSADHVSVTVAVPNETTPGPIFQSVGTAVTKASTIQ